ncbi:MAG: Gfo/Idh/MocA family oxidoreductase [Patescibacteria group bacterium]
MNPGMKIALVGAGGIGSTWAKALQKSGAHVSVVVDTDESRAKEAAVMLGAESTTDWKEAVGRADAAIVAVPHVYLAPIVKGFLSGGVHVLCEKPGGISSHEVADVVALASQKGLVYMPGFNHRYHPAFAEAKRRFDASEIGDLMFIRARYGFGGRKDFEKEWRFDAGVSGGGELLDQGIHMIDIARWFMRDIVDVKGFAENMFWGGGVEDNSFLLLRNAAHRVAQIHVSWTNWDWIHSFEIFGTKGYLIIDGLDSRYRGPERLTVGHADPRAGTFPTEETITYAEEKKEDSLRREAEAFAEAVAGKAVAIPSGADAVAALRIVEEVYGK